MNRMGPYLGFLLRQYIFELEIQEPILHRAHGGSVDRPAGPVRHNGGKK